MTMLELLRGALANVFMSDSGADKEEQEVQPDQVQGPMPPIPLYPRPQGFGQGGKAKAELASRYILPLSYDGKARKAISTNARRDLVRT